MSTITKEDALNYHRFDKPGKLSVVPSKPLDNQRHLGLAYTPGVAYPVLEIEQEPLLSYDYTNKGNLVAVISNGTAILGLGNRGALASKPVMEGKSVLFQKFADIDAFDIEVNTLDPQQLVDVIAAIAPTFGGINLEDIRSPECFWIERTLQSMLDIPVFHDDQHGTAIILAAALLNALEITGRKPQEIKVVFSGAGAAAIACANQLLRIGVPRQNIWMCDAAGLVFNGRTQEMFPEKALFAQGDVPAALADVLPDADVFIGLSVANIVSQEMLKTMNAKPIIFPMANPDPEIPYDLALACRPDAIIGTGRSDYPNQINNVLGFPFIFRGALDVRASAITEEMKIAASNGLAALAKEPVPSEVLNAYGLSHIEFGPQYILPKPLDPRACLWEAPAVAQAAAQSNVARLQINPDIYRQELEKRLFPQEKISSHKEPC